MGETLLIIGLDSWWDAQSNATGEPPAYFEQTVGYGVNMYSAHFFTFEDGRWTFTIFRDETRVPVQVTSEISFADPAEAIVMFYITVLQLERGRLA